MSNRSGQRGSVIQKGNTWHGRYMEDVAGQDKRVRRSVPLGPATGSDKLTKAEARRKLQDLLQEKGINTEAHLRRALNPVETFRQRAMWWENNKAVFFKPSTRRTMVNHLDKHILPLLGDLPLDQVTETTVQEFVAKLHRSGLAPKSTMNIVGVIKLVIGEKIWRDWQLKLPAILRKEQRYFTREQMTKIIEAASARYRSLFCVLAGTGMRIGEAVGLHVADLDLTNNVITIRRSVWNGLEQEPKTPNAYRRVHIDPFLSEMLKEHLKGRTSGRLFESRTGTPLNANNIAKRVLQPVLATLGILGSFHSFRHGRVSILQQNGVPGDLIKEWVGHSTLRTTSRYTHFDDSFRQNIANKLGGLTQLTQVGDKQEESKIA